MPVKCAHINDLKEFKKLLNAVMSMYGKSCSDFMLEMFWSGLRKYTLTEVREALQNHCTHPDTGSYPPKPSDIIRHLSGTSQERAMLAWSKVQDAIPRVGSYRCVVFDDAIIHLVLRDMGGWTQLCRSTQQELAFRGQDFQKRYSSYCSRDSVPPYPNFLKGRQEGSNEPPVFVGDKTLAEQVYAEGEDKHALPHHNMTPEEIQQIQRNLKPKAIGQIVHFPQQDDSV